MMEVVVTTGGP